MKNEEKKSSFLDFEKKCEKAQTMKKNKKLKNNEKGQKSSRKKSY